MIARHVLVDHRISRDPKEPVNYPPFCCTLQALVDDRFLPVPANPYDLYILHTEQEVLYVGKSVLRTRRHYVYSYVTERVHRHTVAASQVIDTFLMEHPDLWESITVTLLSSYSFHNRRTAERDLVRALHPTHNITYIGRR